MTPGVHMSAGLARRLQAASEAPAAPLQEDMPQRTQALRTRLRLRMASICTELRQLTPEERALFIPWAKGILDQVPLDTPTTTK